MHIYAFGSICRGEVDFNSDIDLLAITDHYDRNLNPKNFSIYSYKRIYSIWNDGNPFAWHLNAESKLIFTSDAKDFLRDLGEPNEYSNGLADCKKFYRLFLDSYNALKENMSSVIFELSTVFLSLRNFSTCFLLKKKIKDFSRNSVLNKNIQSLSISASTYDTLVKARLISTRGVGNITNNEIISTIQELYLIQIWMECMLEEINHG